MRILDKEQVLMTLDKLGMREDSLDRFETAFRKPYGAVLVTGPTGSGKSTTLYARAQRGQLARPQDRHDRGPRRVPDGRHHPDRRERQVQPHLRHAACARSSAPTPTSSWSARSGTPRPRASPSSPRSPATWCSARCTPRTRRRPSRASPRWASSPSSPPRPWTASWPSASSASSAPTARSARS